MQVPLGEVRRLDGAALEIAGAAMEGDIGRVLSLGGEEGAATDPVVEHMGTRAARPAADRAVWTDLALAELLVVPLLVRVLDDHQRGRDSGRVGLVEQRNQIWRVEHLVAAQHSRGDDDVMTM